MITYQMPQGVEHKDPAALTIPNIEVITYQMPQGVEHVGKGSLERQAVE